jgi:uncharacterized protein DUF4236
MLRFYKRFALGHLARINLSKSGPSLSIGPRGASMNFSPRYGRRVSIGLPGTGLSYRFKLGPILKQPQEQRIQEPNAGIKCLASILINPDKRFKFLIATWILVLLIIATSLGKAHADCVIDSKCNPEKYGTSRMSNSNSGTRTTTWTYESYTYRGDPACAGLSRLEYGLCRQGRRISGF